MIQKNMMNRITKSTRKKVLLWILIPLIIVNKAFGMAQGAAVLLYGALQTAQALVYAYGSYGAAYKNAYDINHQILDMPQLNAQAFQRVQKNTSSVASNEIPQSVQTSVRSIQTYRSTFSQEQVKVLGAQMFGNRLFPQPLATSAAVQSPAPPSIFKAPPVTAGYKIYEDVVSRPSMWDNVSIRCSAGGQQFKSGPVDVRFETMKSLFSNADAFLAQAQHLDFLDSKIAAVTQSPLVHLYINAATDLFHKAIVNGINVTQATDFIKNVTHIHDSLSVAIHRVDAAQAAALCDIRQAVRSLIYVSYTKHGDFLGIVTVDQKQAVADVYARMLGELAQGGFEQTLNARISAGADYLIPSRDFYFPKGWSKVFYAPLNMLREGISVRSINVASAWCHGEKITEKINNSALNKTIHEVQSLVQHGFLDQASRLVENFNPAFNTGRHCDYAHCYAVLKETFNASKATTLNEFGIPKIYEIHPQWDAFKNALHADPSCQGKVLWQLEHEQAFVLKLLHDLRITNPTEHQLQAVYNLCSYSDVYSFDRVIGGISSFADIQKAIDHLIVHHIECGAVRGSLLGLGFEPAQFEAYMPNLMQFARDPQFVPLLSMLKEQSGSMRDFLGMMAEREKASVVLLTRSGIYLPSDLEKQISYHLIDVMHDKFKVIELLSSLDPQHENPLIRQAYHNFFDSHGIQKLLPINAEVRALLNDGFGQHVNLHQDPEMRFACNRLAIFDVSAPEQFDVIQRGLNYIKQGFAHGSHAGCVRSYVQQYVQALTHPGEDSVRVLSMSDLVDGFLQTMPEDVRVAYGNLLAQALNPVSQVYLHPSTLQEIRAALQHIQTNDFISAKNALNLVMPCTGAGNVSPNISQVQASVPLQTQIPVSNKYEQNFIPSLRTTQVSPLAMAAGFATPSSPLFQQLHSVQVAAHQFLPKYVPQRVNGKGRTQDPFALARWLLEDGRIITVTRDVFVVGIDDECFAHVCADGAVDMMYPRPGDARRFEETLRSSCRNGIENAETRDSVLNVARSFNANVQSHVPEPGSSLSSNAGGPEERSSGCGMGTYGAGGSTDAMPPQCGTSNTDMRPEPYLGAGNPITERLNEALEARRKAEAEILKRLRPGIDPKKLARCGVPRRRSLSDSDLRSRSPSSNIVSAFDMQDGSQAGSSPQPTLHLEPERIIDGGRYGKIVIGADGGIKVISPEPGTIGEYRNPVDVFNECGRWHATKGKSKIFEKNGDFEDGLRDCLSMGATDIKKIPKGIVGTLPDGRSINVRVTSSEGIEGSWPTLEIQELNNNKKMKIRYKS